jgi:phage terminase large subunit-like protein
LAPDQVESYGDEAFFLCSKYGLTPDPWQKLVLDDWLSVREDGKWSSSRCGLSVSRQNGKNGLLEMRELFGIVGLGEKILHTAHEVKTSRKAFLRLASFFENPRKYPELARLVAHNGIRKTNGQEAIVLANGGSVEFVARSKGSARGFTVDVVVMDEAQEMDDDHLEALLPTTASAPKRNRQLIWTGTPPKPEDSGDVFLRVRATSLDRTALRQCWHEWSFPDDADLDDPAVWAIGNPAVGIRLGAEELAEDRASMSDDGFGRERGGMWVLTSSQRVIPDGLWSAIGLQTAAPDGGQMSIAIDMSPDRQTTSLASVEAVGGFPCVDVRDTKRGAPDWVIPRVVEACKRFDVRAVVIDGAGPASSLIEPLRAEKIEVTITGAGHMKRACGMFYDAVFSSKLRHLNQVGLNVAVSAVRKRKLEDAFAWQRKDPDADITPIVAATLALYGFTAQDVKKPRRKTGGATFV